MKIAELVVLLPCHGLEDFPLHHRGAEADSLLAAWTGLWHPALIAAAEATPRWYRMDTPPTEVRSRVLVAPSVGQDRLPIGFVERCKNNGATLIRRYKSRAELTAAALETTGGPPPGLDDDLAADFFALGFARLQIELLARHRHTEAYLDEAHFDQCATVGAVAALAGDGEQARIELGRCFTALYESRKQHYPVDISLIDITLMADTTLGESLRRELAGGVTTNVLLGAELLAELVRLQPASLAALREAVASGAAALVGGDCEHLEKPLAPIETVLRSLTTARADFSKHLGHTPKVYGRRRYGLSPSLPQLLTKLGFGGALHATFDDGRFPLGREAKIRWEGADSSVIDALAHMPVDAADAGAFLEFSRKLADSIDADHVATLSFAHWPGLASPWRDDLRRAMKYSPALGSFVRLDAYFQETALPLVYAPFGVDEYRSPYLVQAVIRREPDPISRYGRLQREEADRAAAEAISLLAALMRPAGAAGSGATNDSAGEAPSAMNPSPAQDDVRADDSSPAPQLAASLKAMTAALPRSASPGSAAQAAGTSPVPASGSGTVLVNPHSFAVTISPAEIALAEGSPAPSDMVASSEAIVVPALGYAVVPPSPASASAASGRVGGVLSGSVLSGRRTKPVAADNLLTGERMLITVNPNSGGIHAIHDFKTRSNRASQRLALRMPGEPPAPGEPWRDPDETAFYATMVADAIEAINHGPDLGEIVSRGRLIDANDRRLAGFTQRVRLRRGSNVARLEIELDPVETLRADPWNSYYATRLAFGDSGATLYRGVHLGRMPTEAQRLEAPDFIDIQDAAGSLSLLAGGHAFHRRVGLRMLDTLLLVRGEAARRFVLGIGLDVGQPATAALELMRPPLVISDPSGAPVSTPAGWLFHLDTRALIATHWAPLYSPMSHATRDAGADAAAVNADRSASRPLGFRVRLLETNGRAGRCELRTPWNLAMGRRTNFVGETQGEIAVQGDTALIEYAAHEWIELEAWWI